MTNWPIKRKNLEPYYKKLMSDMPFSSEAGVHDLEFPLFAKHGDAIPLPVQCADILKRINGEKNWLLENKSNKITDIFFNNNFTESA